MKVRVSAFAENSLVFLFAPMGIVQFVGGVKMFFSGKIYHENFYAECAKYTINIF